MSKIETFETFVEAWDINVGDLVSLNGYLMAITYKAVYRRGDVLFHVDSPEGFAFRRRGDEMVCRIETVRHES